jgi:hypothetical protein
MFLENVHPGMGHNAPVKQVFQQRPAARDGHDSCMVADLVPFSTDKEGHFTPAMNDHRALTDQFIRQARKLLLKQRLTPHWQDVGMMGLWYTATELRGIGQAVSFDDSYLGKVLG